MSDIVQFNLSYLARFKSNLNQTMKKGIALECFNL